MKEYIADKLNITLEELEEGIKKNASFYGVEDFKEEELLPLYLLARIRDLNSDELNMYKAGSYYQINYRNKHDSILFDENFYQNFFKFLERENLKYRLK